MFYNDLWKCISPKWFICFGGSLYSRSIASRTEQQPKSVSSSVNTNLSRLQCTTRYVWASQFCNMEKTTSNLSIFIFHWVKHQRYDTEVNEDMPISLNFSFQCYHICCRYFSAGQYLVCLLIATTTWYCRFFLLSFVTHFACDIGQSAKFWIWVSSEVITICI